MDFVVLCSSKGTTFQAILERIADGSLTAKCLGLISDRETNGCIEKARKADVPFRIVEKEKGESVEEYDKGLYENIFSFEAPPFRIMLPFTPRGPSGPYGRCDQREPRNTRKGGTPPVRGPASAWQDDMYVVCVGWMHIFSPRFVQQFPNRILNVHPALLPKFGGKGMYGMKVHETVLRSGEKESGMTIHLVTKDIDAGPVLIQKQCPVCPGDTPATLKARVQELEKEWYPKLLQMIEEGKLKLP